MSSFRANRPAQAGVQRIGWLIVGDLVMILLFIWVGRGTHELPGSDILAWLKTATPFILAWFLIAPWFGLFWAKVSQNLSKLLPRLLLAWAIAGPVAAVLRALFLGRPIPEGIIPVFVLVTTGIGFLFVLVWRLIYLWWANRTGQA